MAGKYSVKQIVLILLGYLFCFFGLIGVFLPVFPTSPFLIVAYFCFSKGSDKFHNWFLSTQLYKRHLQHFMETKTLTIKQKLFITIPLTISLLVSGIFVKKTIYWIIILLILASVYMFIFLYIKTCTLEKKEASNQHMTQQQNSPEPQ